MPKLDGTQKEAKVLSLQNELTKLIADVRTETDDKKKER